MSVVLGVLLNEGGATWKLGALEADISCEGVGAGRMHL